jgi:hypothetical protein
LLLLSLKIYKPFCVKSAYCLFIFSLLCSKTFAQNVAVISNKPLSSKEFMWAYKKSHNGSTTADYDNLLSYLNLYINFKLKVLDARDMGLDKSNTYQEELKTYESTLASHKKPGLSNKDYDYLLNEYREGVLMFNVSEQKIWSKAQDDEQAIEPITIKTNKHTINHLLKLKGR